MIESITLNLFKKYRFSSVVGMMLRDIHGILNPSAELKMSLKEFRLKHSAELKSQVEKFIVPQPIIFLAKRYLTRLVHLGKNKKDNHNHRRMTLSYYQLTREIKYHQKIKQCPEDFKLSKAWVQSIVYEYFPELSLKLNQ